MHEVAGARELEFEAAVRDGWMPALAAGRDARLLYFLHQAHGTGPSYRVVTITAVRDGAAWERLSQRVLGGDLTAWARDADRLRHDVQAKILVPLPWSPLQDVDLDAVPAEPGEHPLSLFMEDTVWPFEDRFEDYLERSGSHYAQEMQQAGEQGPRMLTVDAGFRTAFGSHRRREVVLWQKVVRPEGMVQLLTRDLPAHYRKAGTWMVDALELRDQWHSRLLRTASWSPWH
ncbi:MAG: hypothetical protein ACREJT_11775 [Myxococcota bacterium]